MKSNSSFEPTGPTILLAADTTAPTGVQVSHGPAENGAGYMIYNKGADTAFIGLGADGTSSKPVIPTAGNPKTAYPVKPGDYLFFRAGPNQFVSAIVGTTAGSVFVTPGRFLEL